MGDMGGESSQNDRLPSISCRCITYGRLGLLEKSVRYFLDQDYKGEKELVILNDDPDVLIEFNHDEVFIVNWNHRFRNVYAKINKAVQFCKNDLIMPWPDDDHFEPFALSTIGQRMKGRKFVCFIPFRKKHGSAARPVETPLPASCVISKQLWDIIGGYFEDGKVADYYIREFAIARKKKEEWIETLKYEEIFYTWQTWEKSRKTWPQNEKDENKFKVMNRNPIIFELKP